MSVYECFFLVTVAIILALTGFFALGVRRFILFPRLPPYISQQIDDLSPNAIKPLTQAQINSYHKNGYLILRNAIDMETIYAMRNVTNFIMENPSGLLKRTNKTTFCGFSLHNHVLIPEWRKIVYNLALSKISSQLMNTNIVLYSQDIIHTTTKHCFANDIKEDKLGNYKHPKVSSRAHSDMNQSPFSIENKYHFGDNMVVAWIGLDKLNDLITMELFRNTHKIFNVLFDHWNVTNYCTTWDYIEEAIMDNELEDINVYKEIINLNVGDVALFQGLTFHRVIKDKKCTLNTCRRVTIRYIDGELTKWRTDIPASKWPFVQQLIRPGELVKEDLPVVYDKSDVGSKKLGIFSSDEPIVPEMKHWFKFVWQIIKSRGFKAGNIIYRCKDESSYA